MDTPDCQDLREEKSDRQQSAGRFHLFGWKQGSAAFRAVRSGGDLLSIDRIAEARDAFIFQCFTGFAYQDMYNLTPDNIVRVGRAGEKWLIKDRGKTDVTEMVPILQELIDKYKSHSYCKINNRLIPVNSNYRYNVYLKELAVIRGIRRELNTHLARHTFADMMLNSGVPLEDVGKMLGHRNIRTTQRYARVRKNRISENMAKVKVKLFTKSGKLKAVA